MPETDWKAELRRRLAPLALPPARESEIVDEWAEHLEDRFREHVARGVGDAEAFRLALAELRDADLLARSLAGVERSVPADRLVLGQAGRGRWFRGLWQDARYALRSLRRSPGFTTAAVLMLALGTGANAAMFSVVDAVLLRSPFRDPARIVMLLDRHDGRRTGALNALPDEVRHLAGMTNVFDSMSAFGLAGPILTGAGEPRRLRVECVSASMFRVLGVAPAAGRAFTNEEDRPGGEPVVVASDRLARQMFEAGPGGAVGQLLTLDGHPVTVVGVMSADFEGARSGGMTDLWAPFGQGVAEGSASGCRSGAGNVFARIRPDLTLATASARLQGMTGGTRGLMSLSEATVGDDRDTLLTVFAAVGFVLLIACANVANLLLERALRRRREIATRLALGASSLRLFRQVLTESVLLATLGTLAGVLAARFVLDTLVALLPVGVGFARHVALNGRALGVALVAGVVAGLLAGLVPAVQAASPGLVVWLSDARSVTSRSRSWTRRALVVTEVALSLALLVGAALMIRSFLTLRPTHVGFDPSNKVLTSLRLSGNRYLEPAARLAFLDDLTDRLSHLPGVQGVSAVSFVPFGGLVAYVPIAVTGRPDLADGHVSVYTTAVTANYFDEMQMSLARGRGILPTDDGRAMPVAVVSEALARRIWPEGNAIGGQISIHARPFDDVPRMVVGVASDIRTSGNTIRPSDQLYLPMAQEPSSYLNVIVRTGDAGTGNLATEIRHTAATVDGSQVLDSVMTLDDMVGRSVARRRSVTWLMSAFAAMAIGLAVAGLMAVIGASVAEQTREIGIRMALGARSGDVLRTVLRQAVALALGGVLIGMGVAAATTRFLAGDLYGVKPLDGATFAGAAALMFVVAIAASYVPARRATRVDPLIALRAE